MSSFRVALVAAVLAAGLSSAYAQSSAPADKAALEADALRLATAWNNARNAAQAESLLQVIHPADRDNGRAFVDAMPRASTAGNATIRVKDIKSINGQRQLITVERSWGGARPGKSNWRLEASDHQGKLYLRIPGGDLSLPKGIKPVVSAIGASQAAAPLVANAPTKPDTSTKPDTPANVGTPTNPVASKVTSDLKLAEPALPYNDGKVYESDVDVKPIVGPLPKIPYRVSISGTLGAVRFGEWLRICEETPSGAGCYLEALLYDQENKSRFLLMRARAHDSGKIAAQFFTPTEIALRPGLTIAAGNNSKERIAFEICRREHCEVNYVLDQRDFSRSEEGLRLHVGYEAEKNKPTQFAVPFVDFFRAIETP